MTTRCRSGTAVLKYATEMPRISANRVQIARMLHEQDVHDIDTWIEYADQRLGVPYPLSKERPGLQKIFNDFMEQHPDGDWHCMVDVVRWARAKKKRIGIIELLASWKYANEQGFMQILQRGGSNDGETLAELLKAVTIQSYRDRMMVARTARERDEVYHEYLQVTNGGSAIETDDTTSAVFEDDRLSSGLVVRYRMSLADAPRLGTLLRQDGAKLVVYVGDHEVALAPRLLQIREDGAWVPL